MNIKMKKCKPSDMQVFIEKSLNSDNKQLELEMTIRRKYLDTGKIVDTLNKGYKCLTYHHLNSRFKYGSKGQPIGYTDTTILPEILFEKSPKHAEPLKYQELKILKGSEWFCNMYHLHQLHLEFRMFDRFSDIVAVLGYDHALYIYNQVKCNNDLIHKVLELPLLIFEIITPLGSEEVTKKMYEIIAILFHADEYACSWDDYEGHFHVYKVGVLVNPPLWGIYEREKNAIPALPKLPAFENVKWIPDTPINYLHLFMPEHLRIKFPWPGAIILESVRYRPSPELRPCGKSAEVSDPQPQAKNTRPHHKPKPQPASQGVRSTKDAVSPTVTSYQGHPKGGLSLRPSASPSTCGSYQSTMPIDNLWEKGGAEEVSDLKKQVQEVSDLKNEVSVLRSELQQVRDQLQQVRSELQHVRSELQHVRSELQHVRSEGAKRCERSEPDLKPEPAAPSQDFCSRVAELPDLKLLLQSITSKRPFARARQRVALCTLYIGGLTVPNLLSLTVRHLKQLRQFAHSGSGTAPLRLRLPPSTAQDLLACLREELDTLIGDLPDEAPAFRNFDRPCSRNTLTRELNRILQPWKLSTILFRTLAKDNVPHVGAGPR